MTDLFGSTAPMPALSLWEPWASLIVAGFKRHETRHWPTNVRGPVAIHAAKSRQGFDCDPELDALCTLAFGPDWRKGRPLGCVVAVANLTGCHRTSGLAPTLPASDLLSGNYSIGRYAFQLDRVRPLTDPLPLMGRQGFFRWTPPADLEARLAPVVDHNAAADRWDASRGVTSILKGRPL